MIIWSGLGFIVGIIGFGCLLLSEYITEFAFKDENYYQMHGWPKLAALLLAASLTWLLSTILDMKKAKVLIDKETGQEVVLRPNHAFFFIPIRFWPYIYIVLGVVFFFIAE